MKIDTSSPVMVTGSTGYVGGVLVKQLLEQGLTVHCPVRDPNNADKLRALTSLPGGNERLKFFAADLLEEGSYLASMKGCSVVFHVASPFVFAGVKAANAKELLLDPAVKGTESVLQSAADPSLNGCVTRVVVTSSVGAIAGDATDCEAVGGLCTEAHWNETSSASYMPYFYSKVLAERAAWDFVEKQAPSYGLVVLNPGFVMGPGIKVHEGSESYKFIEGLGQGTSAAGCPKWAQTVVDVRDVARGHIAAGFLPAETVAGQRYILAGSNTSLLGMSEAILGAFPDYPLPKSESIPKFLLWLLGPYVGFSRWYIWRAAGGTYAFDNAKSVRDLGLDYTPLDTTMQEMFRQCVHHGYVPLPPKPAAK